MDCGFFFVWYCRLIRNSMIGFFYYARNWVPLIYYMSRERCPAFGDCDYLGYIFLDLVYLFWSCNLRFAQKKLFVIGLWVCCIGVVRWEELLPTLYVMFVIRLGDRIRRDSGMKLDFVCEFVRKFVCIELWYFILIPVFLFRRSLRE